MARQQVLGVLARPMALETPRVGTILPGYGRITGYPFNSGHSSGMMATVAIPTVTLSNPPKTT